MARHDMGWLGRSTIVSPSAHRPSMEELGLHDDKPAPLLARTGLAALPGRVAWELVRTFGTGHVRGDPVDDLGGGKIHPQGVRVPLQASIA